MTKKLSKRLPKAATVAHMNDVALEEAVQHFFDTCFVYTNMFIDQEHVTKAQEEERLTDMINARIYLNGRIAALQ